MSLFGHIQTPEKLPEKIEFEAAKRESEEARSYARQSIATAREEMTWLEDALTPDRSRRRLDFPRQ